MALQTMYINATEVWCYRGGWKSDIARFGTASGGHYTDSQIKFTPSVEDLAKLRNARITSVTASFITRLKKKNCKEKGATFACSTFTIILLDVNQQGVIYPLCFALLSDRTG